MIKRYFKADREITTYIDVLGAGQYELFPIFAGIYVPDLLAGDIVLLDYRFEVTNNLGYNVGVSRGIVDHATNNPVTSFFGDNATPAQHHKVIEHGERLQIGTPGTYCWIVTAYAQADVAQPGATLAVEPGYGYFTIVVLSG